MTEHYLEQVENFYLNQITVKDLFPLAVALIGLIAVVIGIYLLYRALRNATESKPRIHQALTILGRTSAILLLVYLVVMGDRYYLADHNVADMFRVSNIATLLLLVIIIGVFFGVGYLVIAIADSNQKRRWNKRRR